MRVIQNVPYGVAFNTTLSLRSVATGEFLAAPALTAGDAAVSKDDGATANLTTLPAENPASSKLVQVSLSATEMEADKVAVRLVDQTDPKQWWDELIVIYTVREPFIRGTVTADTTPSDTQATLSAAFPAEANALVDAWLVALSGANAGLAQQITAYTVDRLATFNAFPNAFADTDRVMVIGG